jgi:radical SAM superfamily enzyme YgiQ (UPF0313 family)
MATAPPPSGPAPVGARTPRRALLVFPRYTPSFGTFEDAYPMVGAKAFMPPQGLLVLAAALPADWQVRFVDENLRPASAEDFAWAEVVMASGMHIQRAQLHDICVRAHAAGRTTALGGPSVSACPQYYPDYDYLHLGELGDATDALVARLEQGCERPSAQQVFTTKVRRDIERVISVGLVAHHLITFARQASAGAQNASFYSRKLRDAEAVEAQGLAKAA